MVESVSAMDGSYIFGVIEEVGANCALRSDRHLMLLCDLAIENNVENKFSPATHKVICTASQLFMLQSG